MLFVLVSLSIFAIDQIQSLSVRKYDLTSAVSGHWGSGAQIADGVDTVFDCEAKAQLAGSYSFAYDKDEKICRFGSIDLSGDAGDASGSQSDNVILRDVPFVGLSHGNHESNGDFDVILPNGKICPSSDHDIPPLDEVADIKHHGLNMYDGVLTMCGGTVPNGTYESCYRLDLNAASPSWTVLDGIRGPPVQNYRIAIGGFVDHVAHDGKWALFALPLGMCHPNLHSRSVDMYKDGEWSWVGKMRMRQGTVVKDGSYLYAVGGLDCENKNETTTDIMAFDMDRPEEDAVKLSHGLAEPLRLTPCTMMDVGGRRGLLCAGGRHGAYNYTMSSTVQFLPFSGPAQPSGPCQVLEPLPQARSYGFIFSLGSGVAILHGGVGANHQTSLVWSASRRRFELGPTSSRNPRQAANVVIQSQWVLEKCWKHL